MTDSAIRQVDHWPTANRKITHRLHRLRCASEIRDAVGEEGMSTSGRENGG